MEKVISEAAGKAMALLEASGFEAFLVGGCVRDFLMGKSAHDVDITTSARPEQTTKVFEHAGYRVFGTGIKHGTVTVLLAGEPLEITTYRVDGIYTDHRRPDSVTFTPRLSEDLARRDFTVNALAWSPSAGLVDVFCGRKDLEAGVIRCVGSPVCRFREDALRIMRALRFSAQLGFEIETETEAALFSEKELLASVSVERLLVELKKLLAGDHAAEVLIRYVDILGVFLPEILPMKGFRQNNPHHIYDVWIHSAYVVSHINALLAEKGRDHEEDGGAETGAENAAESGRKTVAGAGTEADKDYMRLAALFHDVGKPSSYSEDAAGIGHFYGHAETSAETVRDILMRLASDVFTRERVTALIRYHDVRMELKTSVIRRWLSRLGPEVFRELIVLQKADNLGQNIKRYNYQARYDEIQSIAESLIEEQACLSLSSLAVRGGDLIEAGLCEGPEVGAALAEALSAVLDGEVENDRDEILKYLLGI